MHLICPRLEHDVDDSAALAHIGSEIVGLNFELLDGIDRRLDHFNPNLLLVVVEAVQQEIVIGGGESVCLNGPGAPLVFWNAALLHRALWSLVYSRCQISQFDKVPAVQRKLMHPLFLDDLSDGRRLRFNQRFGRRDFDFFVDIAHRQREVDAHHLVYIEGEGRLLGSLKTLMADRNHVGTRP